MNLSDIKKRLSTELPVISKKYQVQSLALFGSFVRGEQKEDSDLDILIRYRKIPGLFEYLELEEYLSLLLGLKVDLVLRDNLKPRIGQQILKEAVEIT